MDLTVPMELKPALPTGLARKAVDTLGQWIVNDRFSPEAVMPTRVPTRGHPRRGPGDGARRRESPIREGPRPDGATLRHPRYARRVLEPARRRRDRLARPGPSAHAPHLRRSGRGFRTIVEPAAAALAAQRATDAQRAMILAAARAMHPGVGRQTDPLHRRLPVPCDNPRGYPQSGDAADAADHPHDAAGLIRVRRAPGERAGYPARPCRGRRSDRPPRSRSRPHCHGGDAASEREHRGRLLADVGASDVKVRLQTTATRGEGPGSKLGRRTIIAMWPVAVKLGNWSTAWVRTVGRSSSKLR